MYTWVTLHDIVVTSNVNASCHVWMSHDTYESIPKRYVLSLYGRVTSHVNASCHIWMRSVIRGCVVSCMDVSCHIGKHAEALYSVCIWIGHVTWHCSPVTCHIWMRPVTCECVMSRMDMSCNISKHAAAFTPVYVWMGHVTWHSIHMWTCHICQSRSLENGG